MGWGRRLKLRGKSEEKEEIKRKKMKIGGKNGRIVGERSGKRMEIRRIMMGCWREMRGKRGKRGEI